MKKLVVYYSYEGNTELIAEHIAEAAGAELQQIVPRGEKQYRGVLKFAWGGKQILMREMPDLEPMERNPADYDIIFLGSPVWAASYPPALRSFFAHVNLRDKRIALFCCHGGGRGGYFRKVREQLEGNTIVGEEDFVEPLTRKTRECTARAEAWARGGA